MEELSISEFKKKKYELEEDLRIIIQAIIATFEIATGFCPNSININVIETTTFGDETRKWKLDSIKVNVEI